MTEIFTTRKMRLASYLDACGFDFAAPCATKIIHDGKEFVSFNFINRHPRLSITASEAMRQFDSDQEPPAILGVIRASFMDQWHGESHNKVQWIMMQCPGMIKIEHEGRTAFIPQNAAAETRAKFAEMI